MPARWAYFDTSVLVKRYVKEEGSSSARDLLHRHRFLSSAIAPLEALSALARHRTSGELEERDFLAIRSRMQKDRAHWELVELSPLVLSQAEELIQRTSVRTLDAVHVASALTFQAASGIRIPFITSDARQREAAEEWALDVIWVE
ncbi:MAG: type II toxin-antitoxin system VapC family toxin [Nitrospirae bacterium]|nr:type II toxin-antitoxin system VapC family toxin [Nitrospirota bacterium]